MLFRKLQTNRTFWSVMAIFYLGLALMVVLGLVISSGKDDGASMNHLSDKGSKSIPIARQASLASYHVFGTPAKKIRELSRAPWKLKGIIKTAQDDGVVIIEINKKEKMLKAGDKIDSSTLIKSIEKEKILLVKDGQVQSLTIFKKQ